MATETVLLFGASGQLGHALRGALQALGPVTAPTRAQADFAQPESLRAIVRQLRPALIVNAAAWTAVDRAEQEPAAAQLVNAGSPGVLAQEAQAIGATLVHYSTDYVFDGSKAGGYREEDAPGPLSVYGRSKLAGERAVAAACQRHLIFRSSWVVGAHGGNFLKTILRLAAERDSLRVVADQFGAPTAASTIAAATLGVLRAMQGAGADDPRWGLYHLAASGKTSWHGYARHLVARARGLGLPLRATEEAVLPITSADYPLPAARPANSVLDTEKLRQTFGLALPDWHEGVNAVLEELTGHAKGERK